MISSNSSPTSDKPSGKISISVVIPAFNEQDWIGKTLTSLTEQQRLADEIIIVNNASTDNTGKIVEDFAAAHPQANIKLIYEVKKGVHHARETGWRAASGNIIAMTDADILFPKDWLAVVENTFKDSTVDAITGIVRYYDALPIVNFVAWACDQLYQPEGIGRWVVKEYILHAGNSAYRRSVLEEVNGYLDKPKELLEDQYMSKRLQQDGYKVQLVRNLKILHTFRRFKKDGWRGYMKYIFFYNVENVYPDRLEEG